MVIMHWLIASLMIFVVLLVMFYWGVKNFQLPIAKETLFATFIVHETFVFFAFGYPVKHLQYSTASSHPPRFTEWQPSPKKIEKSIHLLLQYGVIVLTVLGWATANAKGYELRLFWQEWLTLPNLVELGAPKQAASNTKYQRLLQCYSYLAFTMIAVVALHIAGVIMHRLKGHNILARLSLR